MKCLLLADNRPQLTATLEPILKHWGYRVITASDVERLKAFLNESNLSLLIIGEEFLNNPQLSPLLKQVAQEKELPIMALQQEHCSSKTDLPCETLEVPVDVFALFSFIQRHVEKHPRQNLRLRLQLPGMYRTKDDGYILADVLSLSTQGLFFKTSHRLKQGDRLNVVIPLLGHCQELEIDATVLYVIEPLATNNYMQGLGVGFEDMTAEQKDHLQKYIEHHFLNQIAAHQDGTEDPSTLRTRN
ncbi:MAG: hypothetical protein C0614_13650 [Desulfuromonas sp.]|nr:MAG: hypothetical protein C0614_13650 [Desulfuromonas sp.]